MFGWHFNGRHICSFHIFETIVSPLILRAIFINVGKYQNESCRGIRIASVFTKTMKG